MPDESGSRGRSNALFSVLLHRTHYHQLLIGETTWQILETNFLLQCKSATLFKQPMLANCNCHPSGGLILISSCLWYMCVTGLKNSAKALLCLMKRSFVWFRVALPQDRDFWQEDFNQNNCLIIRSLILFLHNDFYKKWKNMITCSNENESYFLIVCLI